MSIAERRVVPLNSRCSRKCDTPDWAIVSSREPTATQTPNETLRMAGTASVMMRRPLGSTVRRTVPPSGSSAMVDVRARVMPSAVAHAAAALLALAATTLAARAALAPARPAVATVTVTAIAPVARAAVTAVPPGRTVLAGLRGGRLGPLRALLVQVDLPAAVDLGDLHLDLVAHVQV